MSSPFVWFHHNGREPNDTRKFLESLLSVQASDGPGGTTMLASGQAPFAANAQPRARLEPTMTTYALLIYRTTPAAEPIPELEERKVLAGHRNEHERRQIEERIARLAPAPAAAREAPHPENETR